VAQLGARFHGMEEVIGSIPIRSTKNSLRISGLRGKSRAIMISWQDMVRAHNIYAIPRSVHLRSEAILSLRFCPVTIAPSLAGAHPSFYPLIRGPSLRRILQRGLGLRLKHAANFISTRHASCVLIFCSRRFCCCITNSVGNRLKVSNVSSTSPLRRDVASDGLIFAGNSL
jgi:hypothetical protein